MLANIEANLANATDIKELKEGVEDPKQSIKEASWQSEVATNEEFGRWSACLTTVFCALLHLPALALESCWPSLLGQMFSFSPDKPVLRTSHWVALGATLLCLGLNKGFLYWGAKQRRGFSPLLVSFAGSWFVILNPIYFLLADYEIVQIDEAAANIVLVLTVFGLMVLIWAASWNASVDKMVRHRWGLSNRRTCSSEAGEQGGVHVLVEGHELDLDDDDLDKYL